MSDIETINVYNSQATEYAELVHDIQENAFLRSFASRVTDNDHILDLGCGPGNASAYFLKCGFQVDAVDASIEMVRIAKSHSGVDARCAEFSDIASVDLYDGVWANFSLLHAKHDEFTKMLEALHRSLKPGGVFHIGMKIGVGEGRDHLGRFYSYYSQDDLLAHLKNAGFAVIDSQLGEGCGLAGTVDPWIVVLSAASLK